MFALEATTLLLAFAPHQRKQASLLFSPQWGPSYYTEAMFERLIDQAFSQNLQISFALHY
jgi:hypothetical protein